MHVVKPWDPAGASRMLMARARARAYDNRQSDNEPWLGAMGDPQDLVVRCIPSLRRYAHALTRDPDSADDLVQDTLERAWSRIHLWRGEENIRPWLFRILHSIHVSRERRRQRRPVLMPLDDDLAAGNVASPEASSDLRRVASACDQLPDEQRQVLLLVVLEGFSYQQVADILVIPIGTVMSRLFRARERLRMCLASQA